jgi:hypothetical protein
MAPFNAAAASLVITSLKPAKRNALIALRDPIKTARARLAARTAASGNTAARMHPRSARPAWLEIIRTLQLKRLASPASLDLLQRLNLRPLARLARLVNS